MKQLGISVNTLIPQAEVLRAEGASVMYLAADGKLLVWQFQIQSKQALQRPFYRWKTQV